MLRIGVDIGGTFTDLTVLDEAGTVHLWKEPSTPDEPMRAIGQGLSAMAAQLGRPLPELLEQTRLLVHGTTIATNTVIQRNGPATGLLCTEGFRDILYFRDAFKPERFNLRFAPPEPFVDRYLRRGVAERIAPDGSVEIALDEDRVREAAAFFRAQGVASVAVAFLWSIVNDAHEQRAAEILRDELPGVHVVCSADVLPEIREWERTSAAALSAYILPDIADYFRALKADLRAAGLREDPLIMQLNGGCAPIEELLQRPVYALHSGPAAAPAAARWHAERRGLSDVIVVDMGGTSFDVCLVQDGAPVRSRVLQVEGQPVGVAGVAVHSVGAGGGSIASVDDGGALRVGPRSAGSVPGPAAYGAGGAEPTVTDANVVLGYLSPHAFLGGRRELRADLAAAAIDEHVAGPLGLDTADAAAGVVRVVNASMVSAIRAVSVERGLDPRGFALVVGGGAGGLHAVELARQLEIERVIVPREAGTLCAFGMTVTDVRHDELRAQHALSADVAPAAIGATFAALEEQGRARLLAQGFAEDEITLRRSVDARYPGQVYELTIDVPSPAGYGDRDLMEIERIFHAEHLRQFGYSREELAVEFLHWRVSAAGRTAFATEEATPAAVATFAAEPAGRREIFVPGEGLVAVPVHRAEALTLGAVVEGPAVIAGDTTTILLGRGDVLTCDDPSSFLIDVAVVAAEAQAEEEAGATSPSEAIDPITFSVMMRRLESISQEMTQALERSAWSSIIALCHDFSCVIYDTKGRQVCVHDPLPALVTSIELVMAEIEKDFSGDIADGDVFLMNDPYRGNTHVGDLVTARPVFVDGRHRFWSVVKAHHLDVGAFVPASCTGAARSVYQEGLTIPPLKIVAGGVPRRDVLRALLANVRYRDLVEGDLLAQIGSIEKGCLRLEEFCREFGTERALAYVDEVIAYADRRMAAAIEAIPDGVYEGGGWIDTDGHDALNVPVKATVTVSGDHVLVDFAGTGAQAAGGFNGSRATTLTSGRVPFLYFADPDIPHNQGCFDHIDVVAPEGSIANPVYPASTSCATIVPSSMLHDAVNMAMASAIPDRVTGGTSRCSNVPQFSGVDAETGREWAMMIFNDCGGGGATKEADGWPLMESPAAMGGQKLLPIEQMELLYPVRVEQMEIETDSMGLGARNGGAGVRFVIRPLSGPMECITFGDGCANPPHGVLGATAAIGGGQYVEDRQTGRRRFISASGHVIVGAQEAWVGVATGGGGYGSPLERDGERVRRDVRDGIVSAAAAYDVYGVVLDGAADPTLDVAATVSRRALLAREPRPLITPTQPDASPWLAQAMRPGDVYLVNPDPSSVGAAAEPVAV